MEKTTRCGRAPRTPIARRSGAIILFAAVAILISGSSRADVVTIVGSSDANFTDPNLSGTFTGLNTENPSTVGLVVNKFTNLGASNTETRSAIAFNLAALPTGATVQGVTFTFQEAALTSTAGQGVGVFGYGSSTGTLGLADATASATSLVAYDPTALGLGTHTLTLTAANLPSLVEGSNFLVLRLQAVAGADVNTSLFSLEVAKGSTDVTAPTITVTYTPAAAAVPEPSALALSAILALPAAACGFRRWRQVRRAD